MQYYFPLPSTKLTHLVPWWILCQDFKLIKFYLYFRDYSILSEQLLQVIINELIFDNYFPIAKAASEFLKAYFECFGFDSQTILLKLALLVMLVSKKFKITLYIFKSCFYSKHCKWRDIWLYIVCD